MEELISVIIPVYNVKEYLERCIRSVIGQSYMNLEIIFVDDGSTDGSGEICDRYAEEDPRIIVLRKENGGLSSARNAALDIVKGRCITFVDSDDFIHEKMIEVMYHILCDESADMVCCECERGDKDCFTAEYRGERNVKSYAGRDLFLNLFNENKEMTVISCAKLYRAEIFHELRYPLGMIYEDEFLIHHILNECSKTVYIFDKLYYHFFRRESISNCHIQQKNFVILQALNERNTFFEEMGDEELVYASHIDFMRRVQFYYYTILKYFPEQSDMAHNLKKEYQKIYDMESGKMPCGKRMRYGLFLRFPGINRMIKHFMGARRI